MHNMFHHYSLLLEALEKHLALTHQLPNLIKQVPLLNIQPYYSLLDYENFLYQQNNRLKNHDGADEINSSLQMEQFEQALFNTSKSFQYQNYQHFNEILNHWNTLKQVLDLLMELEAPSFANIDSQLENIQKALKKIYKAETFGSNIQPETEQNIPLVAQPLTSLMNTQSQHSFQPQPQSHLQNREQAMNVLQEIADYFQANEPHSPVSYMLQKTIKWNQMPLHEWLGQVIQNENPLESVQELLGVQQNSNESNGW